MVHNDNSFNGLSPLGLLEVLTLTPPGAASPFSPATGNGDQEQGHFRSSTDTPTFPLQLRLLFILHCCMPASEDQGHKLRLS